MIDRSACCGLTQTTAVEDALRTIFVRSGRGDPISTSALAAHLSLTPPTVSSMLKRLTSYGLLERAGDRHALTPHGREHAQVVVRRHRLLETYLVTVFELAWHEVHDEADALEHAVSDRLLDRIDQALGHPTHDPHGDPIPSPAGLHDEVWGERLDTVEPGTHFRVERVYDRYSEALRYLAELGVRPGVTVEVLERSPFGGPLWIGLNGQRCALGDSLVCLVHGRENR
ncbi:MAG TPA: metal-dependent transcriptional regulator [Pseudonocardiaceae bacterium]|nr:metal-dependent transcriptional regulator [Pseudonocardiaceae bacterium]